MVDQIATAAAVSSAAVATDIKYIPGQGFKKIPRDPSHKKPGLNWLHINILLGIPLFALYGILTTELQTKTLVLAAVSYFLTGFGITGGYHRLWSHRCWNAVAPVRFLVLMFGAAALQGSARWWCRNHRAHHKFTDTTKDPYNVRAGFMYAHFGWMMFKQDPKEVGFANIDDLNADWMIMFQHKYYGPIALFTSIALPTMIAGLGWGDWRLSSYAAAILWRRKVVCRHREPQGGYFYASLCRIVFVHHATFFVNSLAHYLGDQAYSDLHTAFDSMITALLTLGEGYHNYHHEFPQDFRNGIRWYQYDPTKWTIMALYYLGLAYDLRFIPDNEVEKARIQVKKARLTAKRNELAFGKDLKENLPVLSARDLQLLADAGKQWVIIEDRVYDVTDFLDLHPGGRDTLLTHAGNDVSSIFRGDSGQHIHSNAAEAMLPRYIIGQPGPDVTWGQND